VAPPTRSSAPPGRSPTPGWPCWTPSTPAPPPTTSPRLQAPSPLGGGHTKPLIRWRSGHGVAAGRNWTKEGNLLTGERLIVREAARYWWLFLLSGILWLLIAW